MTDQLPTYKDDQLPIQRQPSPDSAMAVEAARAMAEVKGAMVLAREFPRDENKSYSKIMEACRRKSLAESAVYSYPRGGQVVKGPSIRMAEVLARYWENIQYGVRELSQSNGESCFEAYAWDLETNVRIAKTFTQKHGRYTKNAGFKAVDDPRDIYEVVANVGARRLRACILELIPGDIVEAAVEECQNTIRKGDGTPFKDRVRKMVAAFDAIQISQEMLEKRLGHAVKDISEDELVDLQVIYKTVKNKEVDRMSFFPLAPSERGDAAALNEALQVESPSPATSTGKSTRNSKTSQTQSSPKGPSDANPPPSDGPPSFDTADGCIAAWNGKMSKDALESYLGLPIHEWGTDDLLALKAAHERFVDGETLEDIFEV